MCNLILRPLALGIFCLFSISITAQRAESNVVFAEGNSKTIQYPISVISIIEAKCIGCHSEQGRNEDAKEALMWKNLQDMESGMVVGILEDVLEQIEEGTMPPEKMVKKYPSMELSAEEKETLKTWILSMQDQLEN